jgi:hypothetical protein
LSVITLDLAKFRSMFPVFGCGNPYTDSYIIMRWDIATCFISDSSYGCLSGKCRENALLYVTAHIMQLENAANGACGNDAGAQAGVIQSASIDAISVAVQVPPGAEKSKFSWWLSQTPYGQQALGLLSAAAVGGLFIGGSPERSAFRKVGGVF